MHCADHDVRLASYNRLQAERGDPLAVGSIDHLFPPVERVVTELQRQCLTLPEKLAPEAVRRDFTASAGPLIQVAARHGYIVDCGFLPVRSWNQANQAAFLLPHPRRCYAALVQHEEG